MAALEELLSGWLDEVFTNKQGETTMSTIRPTIFGTVVGSPIAGGFVHLTVAEVDQSAPVTVEIGMKTTVPAGSTVRLSDGLAMELDLG